jgi:hypothetical protein
MVLCKENNHYCFGVRFHIPRSQMVNISFLIYIYRVFDYRINLIVICYHTMHLSCRGGEWNGTGGRG